MFFTQFFRKEQKFVIKIGQCFDKGNCFSRVNITPLITFAYDGYDFRVKAYVSNFKVNGFGHAQGKVVQKCYDQGFTIAGGRVFKFANRFDADSRPMRYGRRFRKFDEEGRVAGAKFKRTDKLVKLSNDGQMQFTFGNGFYTRSVCAYRRTIDRGYRQSFRAQKPAVTGQYRSIRFQRVFGVIAHVKFMQIEPKQGIVANAFHSMIECKTTCYYCQRQGKLMSIFAGIF